MSQRAQHIVSIIILSIFILVVVGPVFIFKMEQYKVRKEIKTAIKQGVPEHELTVIRVDESNKWELKWIEGHEFRYKGRMYDVVRSERNGSVITYYCVHDKQEEKLFNHLDELVNRKMGNEQERDHIPYQVLRFDGTLSLRKELLTSIASDLVTSFSDRDTFSCKTFFGLIFTPPPQGHDLHISLNRS